MAVEKVAHLYPYLSILTGRPKNKFIVRTKKDIHPKRVITLFKGSLIQKSDRIWMALTSRKQEPQPIVRKSTLLKRPIQFAISKRIKARAGRKLPQFVYC
jgi:ribosome biogenesis GTPase A